MSTQQEKSIKILKKNKELLHLTEDDILTATPLPAPFIGKLGVQLRSGERITTGFKFLTVSWDTDSGAGSDW